jgi:flagellar basal body-associated protein FliL
MVMFIAYLLGILTAIKPKDHNGYCDHGASDTDKDQSLPNGPISVICLPRTYSNQEQTENKNKKRRDAISFWVGIGSLVVLTVYAGVTILIWCTMEGQSKVLRQQLEGTEAAVMKIETGFNLSEEDRNVTLSVTNVGRVVARDIAINLQITRRSLPDERILEVLPEWKIVVHELGPNDPRAGELHSLDITPQQLRDIMGTTETVRIDGELRYNNGFRIQTDVLCRSILMGDFKNKSGKYTGNFAEMFPCAEFQSRLRSRLQEKSARETKN